MGIEHRLHARCGGGHHELSTVTAAEHGAAARPFAFTTSPRHFERDRPFSVEHLALDVALDFEHRKIVGSASLVLRRVDPEASSVCLDAIGFAVETVTLDGKGIAFQYDGRLLTAEIDRAFEKGTLTVVYSATPRRGLYFLEPDEHVPGRPRQAWTQCQEEDARHVFPCHDKPHVKMTTEARVRVPAGFYVLSNGELDVRTKDGDSEIFHWKMRQPHPSYLVTIVAGEFAELTDVARAGDREVALSYLVPRGREEDGKRTFANTAEMIRWFSELFGVAYPWTRYAQVVVSDFIFGGMENTTATTMYEHILIDARAAIDVTADDLVAHELAHQWFGDYVTCRDWSESWLNEGFATFCEHVWQEHHLGRDEYDYGLKNHLGSYLGEATGRYRRAIVCLDYDAPLDLFDRHLYEKGALVLHVLRRELGDTLFWRGITTYLRRHGGGIVETRDLQRALEEVSGRSLGRRFEELVHRPGHPELSLELAWEKGVLKCSIEQTQSTQDGVPSAFEVPVLLAITDEKGGSVARERIERVKLAARKDTFAIPCPKRPRFVVVDPEMQILGDVTIKAPTDMLRHQLLEARTARGRWAAAQALAKSDDPVTIEALAARLFDDDEFWGVRAEAADALGRIRARECEAALTKASTVRHPKVRRAVMDALGRFRTAAAAATLQKLALRDESYLVEAEAARALGRTRQTAAFDVLLDVMDRPSWADVIASGAMDGLAALRDERALPHLYARTRYGHPQRVRRAASLAIPKLSTDRRAREHLEELLDDGDPILRLDVVRALADLGDSRSRGALRARIELDLDPRVRRRIRETLRDLGTERQRTQRVEEDLHRLREEQAELKARLAVLEARGKQAGGARAPSKKQRTAKAGARKRR